METWQELLRKKSIASLDALADRFGAEHVGAGDICRLRQAAENFEFRISPAMVDLIQSPDDPIWKQYVPTLQELEVRGGFARGGCELTGSKHHASLSRPRVVPGLPSVRFVLQVLHA